MNRTGFIVNGRKSVVRKFTKSFKKHAKQLKGEYNVLLTSGQGHGLQLAKELANDGYTHIIAVGGDGTLHEVVNGIMESNNKSCVVGLLPSGTANDYAKSIGEDTSLANLVDKLNNQARRSVNLGRIKLSCGTTRYFINIADMGLGVDVVLRVNQSRKWLGPGLTFSKAILRSFLTYKNQEVLIEAADSWRWQGRINSLVIANGKYFGSGMCIAPEADHQGDAFSIVIIGDVKIKDYVRYISKIKKGEKLDHPEVYYKSATVLAISSNSGIEADGEYIGAEPKVVELVRGQLNFLL